MLNILMKFNNIMRLMMISQTQRVEYSIVHQSQYHQKKIDHTLRIIYILRYKASFFTQARWLLWRSSIDTFKNPFEFRLRVILTIVISVLIGLIFLRLPYDQESFQNISAVIFLMVVNLTFTNVQKNADVSSNRDYVDLLRIYSDIILEL